MSHFVECRTEFRDPQALVAALMACGFAADQIEVHAEVVPLYGTKATNARRRRTSSSAVSTSARPLRVMSTMGRIRPQFCKPRGKRNL
jgi:hypothetical protein